MAKKRIFMVMVFALLSTVFAAGVFAQVTVSGGFALSSIDSIEIKNYGSIDIDTEMGIGGNIYADYLLPVSIPLSLGAEIGIDSGKFSLKGQADDGGDTNETMTVVPLLLRAAYHFDLMANLDLYVVGKIGYAIGFWSGDFYDNNAKSYVDDIGGIAFGFDVGAAYYFTPTLGAFAEVGFDDYALKTKIQSATLEAPFKRFVTFGISAKFMGRRLQEQSNG
jgi:opacity protein-like surface antigen